MRLSLLGLGLLAPTASLGQVIETVWIGTGDCSPTVGVGDSGDGGNIDHFGTETLTYTRTETNSIVTTGTETSMHPIVRTSVGSSAGGSDDHFGTEIFAYPRTKLNSTLTTGIETSIYPIIPASVAFGTTTVVVTSTDSNGAPITFTTITSIHSIISTIESPQPAPLSVGTDSTTTNSLESTVVTTSTYVSTTTGTETSTYPTIPASVASVSSGTTTMDVASTKANGVFAPFTTATSSYPITSPAESSQPGPVTVENEVTTTIKSLGPTSTYVSFTTGIGTSSYPIISASVASNDTVATFNATSSTYQIVSPTQTIATNIMTTAYGETFTTSTGAGADITGTPRGINNGSQAVSSTDTGSSVSTIPSPVTNGSYCTATGSGAEPTCSNISPTCSSNNTYYVDTFGVQYDIRCGLGLANAEDASLVAHADTFEGCIQYCSLLLNCSGVSYQGTDCLPIAHFRGYQSDEGSGLLTAIPTAGASNGSVTPDDLCAEGFDGQPYTDFFGCTWSIFCNQTIGGTALQSTIQTNLEACIYYCAFYDGCESIYFEGLGGAQSSGEAQANPNCFPMSSIGTTSPGVNVSAASLQGTCNVSSLVPTYCDYTC